MGKTLTSTLSGGDRDREGQLVREPELLDQANNALAQVIDRRPAQYPPTRWMEAPDRPW
jgi:hypothetical protein